MDERKHRLESAIDALEAQRTALGDAVVDAAIGPLRAELTLLQSEPAAQTPRLAHVSVLFLDVVGSTALARQLDAEDLQAVVDGLLARCTAVVQEHGGKVLQYAGDSLLAVFGAERTEEDDAERAVRAGLALLDEGRREGAHVLQRHGHAGFDVRVGIHSGGVLLGGGVDAEGSIRGVTVHIAARMEQTAPVGGLRISRETYRQVRGMFEVRPEAPIAIKGVDELVTTYLVLRSQARAFDVESRGIEGVDDLLEGADEISIRWVCHRVLAAAGDARADAALAAAHAALEARAAAIANLELRESYLEASLSTARSAPRGQHGRVARRHPGIPRRAASAPAYRDARTPRAAGSACSRG